MSALVSTSYVVCPTLPPTRRPCAKRSQVAVRAENKREGGSDLTSPLLVATSAFFSAGQALALTYERDLPKRLVPPSVSPPAAPPVPSAAAPVPPPVPSPVPSSAPPSIKESIESATSAITPPSFDLPALPDVPDLPDLSSVQDNPALLAVVLGVAALGLGVIIVQQTGKSSVKGSSPAAVEKLLKEDANVIFVDIRSTSSVKKSGSPSVKDIKAKSRSLAFTQAKGKDEEGETVVQNFGEKFTQLKGIQEDSVIVLFDFNGTMSPKAAAEILKYLEFEQLLYVTGGEKGWKAADLEWKEPSKAISFSLPSLPVVKGVDVDLAGATKSLADATKGLADASTKATKGLADVSTKATKGLAGATKTLAKNNEFLGTGAVVGVIVATSLVVISEIETILEVVGLIGAINILSRQFLFAKKREKTLNRLKALLKEDIAPQEAAKDLQRLASAVLNMETAEEVEASVAKADVKKAMPSKVTAEKASKENPAAGKAKPQGAPSTATVSE